MLTLLICTDQLTLPSASNHKASPRWTPSKGLASWMSWHGITTWPYDVGYSFGTSTAAKATGIVILLISFFSCMFFVFRHQTRASHSEALAALQALPNNNNCCGFTSRNHDMIMRNTVVEGSGSLDHLVFFNVRLNLSTLVSTTSPPSKCGHRGQNSIPRPSGQHSNTITTTPP